MQFTVTLNGVAPTSGRFTVPLGTWSVMLEAAIVDTDAQYPHTLQWTVTPTRVPGTPTVLSANSLSTRVEGLIDENTYAIVLTVTTASGRSEKVSFSLVVGA